MADIKYPSMQRVTDIGLEGSISLETVGPRSFNASQTLALVADIRRLEGALALLCMYVTEHRTTAASASAYHNEYTAFNVLATAADKQITVGELTLLGAEMHTIVTATAPTDARVGAVGPYELKIGSTTLWAGNISSYAAHAMLRALPSEIYHAMGSLFEEVSSTAYKGRVIADVVTSIEMAALIRLQDKITKQSIEACKQTPLGSKDGLLIGPEAYAGAALARQNAELILRQLAPVFAAWLLDREPLGTRAFATSAVS